MLYLEMKDQGIISFPICSIHAEEYYKNGTKDTW